MNTAAYLYATKQLNRFSSDVKERRKTIPKVNDYIPDYSRDAITLLEAELRKREQYRDMRNTCGLTKAELELLRRHDESYVKPIRDALNKLCPERLNYRNEWNDAWLNLHEHVQRNRRRQRGMNMLHNNYPFGLPSPFYPF